MHLFLDLDGTLADFAALAEEIFGMPPRDYEYQYGNAHFWKMIESHGNFFADLPLMPDAMELWNATAHLNPVILTGVPRDRPWAAPQKREWVARHFGKDVPVITCRSREKRNHFVLDKHNVIVDDWPEYKHLWEEAGGTFILHTHAAASIARLQEIGII